jgi:hypothetical protein
MYQAGLLKPKVLSTRPWWGSFERCLGPKAKEFEMGNTYPLTLQNCPKDDDDDDARHMRFLMIDGRVQSLAPVVVPSSSDDAMTTPYCMTIQGNVAMQSAGSSITLKPCDSQNMLQQGIQSYGTVRPFLFASQSVWGYSDVVELAYALGQDDSDTDPVAVTMTIYNQREEKVHSLQATTASGILSFSVSDLVEGDSDASTTIGEYVAKMETDTAVYSVAFSVAAESHVAYVGSLSAAASLLVVMAVVGVAVGFILLTVAHNSSAYRKQASMDGDEDEEATVIEQMDDEGFETPKEDQNDDATETLGQATSSNDSNNDAELVSDQA